MPGAKQVDFCQLVNLQLPRYQRMSKRSTAPAAGARCRIIDQANAENKGFGRGGAIRTPDPLRPRHRNVRYEKLRKLRVFNALAAHRLQPKSAYGQFRSC